MKQNPWAGLASYQDPAAGSTLLFCGRDNESYDLAALVDDNIFCTLYGKSGTGKTSLLNAGVFPRLREMGYLPVSIRLGMEAMGTTFQQCIVNRLAQVAGLQTTDAVAMPSDDQDEQWLWAWFARTRFVDGDGKTRFAVLVFDQFEEVFRSRRDEAEVLLRQIHFMMDPSHSLGESYDYNFRFLASIREDDLYLLEDSLDRNFMGDMKQCRYRLNALTDEGARDVILKPGQGLFVEGEQDEIVNTIIGIARSADGSINTNILSLVCSRIYEEYRRNGAKSISLELVRGFVSSNPFEQFYNEVTATLGEKEKQFIEDRLVDAAGRRGSVSEPDFEKHVPNGAHLLEGTGRILQRVASGTEGRSYRIELIHDSFCAPLADQKLKRAARRRRRIITALSVLALVVVAVAAYIIIMSVRNARQTREILIQQERFYAYRASQLLDEGDTYTALLLLNELTDPDGQFAKIPLQPEAERQMRRAVMMNDTSEWQIVRTFRNRGYIAGNFLRSSCPQVTADGKFMLVSVPGGISVFDYQTGAFVKKLQSGKYDVADDEPKFSLSHNGDQVAFVYYGQWPVHIIDIETGRVKIIEETLNERQDGIKYCSWNEPRFNNNDQSVVVFVDSTNRNNHLLSSIQAFDVENTQMVYMFDSCERADALENGNFQGRRIATNSGINNVINIHDINNGKLLYKFDIGECRCWKYLSDDILLVIKKDAVYQYTISEKKWAKVIERSFDMNIFELGEACLSKNLLLVSNNDTLFMYDIASFNLVSTFKFDWKKYNFACLNQFDNNLVLGNSRTGVIYLLKPNKDLKKSTSIYAWYYYNSEMRFIGDSLLFLTEQVKEKSKYSKYELWRVCDNSVIFRDTTEWLLEIKDISPNGQYVVMESHWDVQTSPTSYDKYNFGLRLFDVCTGHMDEINCNYYDYFNLFFISDTQLCYSSRDSNYNAIMCKYNILSHKEEQYMAVDESCFDIMGQDNAKKINLLRNGTFYDYEKNEVTGKLPKMSSGNISPDGKYILSSGSDGIIRLYDNGLKVIDSCFGKGTFEIISSDNKYAVKEEDGKCELWSLFPLYKASYLNCKWDMPMVFSTDNRFIITPLIRHEASEKTLDGFIKIPLYLGEELFEKARAITGSRKLTEDEKTLLME